MKKLLIAFLLLASTAHGAGAPTNPFPFGDLNHQVPPYTKPQEDVAEYQVICVEGYIFLVVTNKRGLVVIQVLDINNRPAICEE